MELLFWPSMIASIVLSFLAFGYKKPMFLVISFFLFIPISLYLAATPRFGWWGLVFPFFYLGAALVLRKKRRWLSVLFVLPNLFLVGWIGYIVVKGV